MTDLKPDHPAVQVGCQAASEWVDDASADEPDHTYPDCPKCIHCSEMASSGTRRIAVLWPCDTVAAMFGVMEDDA